MGWAYLLIATAVNIVWVLTLRSTAGYTKLLPSLINISLAIVQVWILARAIQLLPTATAYAVCTGLTGVGVAVLAYALQGEEFGVPKVLCITLIVAGVVGLRLLSPE